MLRVGLCAAALAVCGCGASAAVRAADRGDIAALSRALAERERAGSLSNAEAAQIAEAVASRDVEGASGEAASARVSAASSCVRALDDALAKRARSHDPTGALAALERLDAGALAPSDAKAYRGDPDGAWRAVGARSLVDDDDALARRAALADADPRVRRQAVRASITGADAGDLPSLLEVARVDPDGWVKSEAVRAIAALTPPARRDVVEALADLWTRADDGLREDIAIAWSRPALYDAGGRDALSLRIAAGRGAGVTEASLAVLRHGATDELERDAVDREVRAIFEGSRPRRLQAIAGAPLERAEIRQAVERASSDPDLEIRVGALERLAGPEHKTHADAVASLESLASPGSPVAARARFALAIVHDRRVQAWIEADLASPDATARLGAAQSLAALGVAARGAPLLADPDATVRIRAACVILDAERHR